MSDSAIRIHRVNKRFGQTHAVRDLDLEVPAGSLCGFLGPNGAGKSTTIRMIMSIIYPDSGSIDVLGGTAIDRKDRIGYLPEERGLYRKMRITEFLRYVARLKGMPTGGLDRTIMDWLERVELGDVARKRCQELSKGMQQKIQFLAAIIHEPDLIILDEPFSGLDPVNAELLNRLIDELHDEGRTVVFSTHVLHQAEQICDRIFLINHGVKLLDDSLDEIRRRFDPKTLEVVAANGTGAGDDDGSVLREIEGVIDATPLPGDGAWELALTEAAEPQEIIRAVVQRWPVRSVQLRRVSLEEAFVQLVRADEGPDAARQAREELSHV